ncbi:hypothetical protein LPTSP4_36520 [Leptospira ryugenii]|uniref:Uncharacterized protein n=1 Tax=Leptospira ryugenii TaxID=1917863 RepID=A0A2P2E5H8_9LEPT|nr:hypothetical protein [Leptospira ryugenii]GBF52114.1 hypothetical protein LPTSP4_36520 [Leptospira ryugenii]
MRNLSINSNYETIPIDVQYNFDEIMIKRKWNEKSYFKFESLNNYSILINKENLTDYSAKLFKEKIVNLIPSENKNISISIQLTSSEYVIEKEFGLFFPTQIVNSNITAVVQIQNRVKIKKYLYSNGIKNRQTSLGNPFTSFCGGFLLLRMANLNLLSSAIGSTLSVGTMFYIFAKDENIEILIERDLESLGNFIRDSLIQEAPELNLRYD